MKRILKVMAGGPPRQRASQEDFKARLCAEELAEGTAFICADNSPGCKLPGLAGSSGIESLLLPTVGGTAFHIFPKPKLQAGLSLQPGGRLKGIQFLAVEGRRGLMD